jgi:hypothetical protein
MGEATGAEGSSRHMRWGESAGISIEVYVVDLLSQSAVRSFVIGMECGKKECVAIRVYRGPDSRRP